MMYSNHVQNFIINNIKAVGKHFVIRTKYEYRKMVYIILYINLKIFN